MAVLVTAIIDQDPLSEENLRQLPEANDPIERDYWELFHLFDAIDGNNPISKGFGDHGMLDSYMKRGRLQPPPIFFDPRAKALRGDLEKKPDTNTKNQYICDLVKEYGFGSAERLLAVADKLMNEADPIQRSRGEYIHREVSHLKLLIELKVAQAEGKKNFPLDKIWETMGADPNWEIPVLEVQEIREQIAELLASEGIAVTNPNFTLDERVNQWAKKEEHLVGEEQAERILSIVKAEAAELIALYREKLFPLLNFPEVGFDVMADERILGALEFTIDGKMPFDAGQAFLAGLGEDGKPICGGNFAWRHTREASETDIRYITAHETGHLLNHYLTHVLSHAGLLGPEAGFIGMYGPRYTLEEGVAQNMAEMLYGGLDGVQEARGKSYTMEILRDRLQDIVRSTTAKAAHQARESGQILDLPTLRNRIQTEFVQTKEIAEKYAGDTREFWRGITGGSYATSYYKGSRSVRKGLETHGVEKVLPLITHRKGLVDVPIFEKRLTQGF